MIRIICISRINFLSGRTNVYNLTKTLEALNTQKDLEVTLVKSGEKQDEKAFFNRMGVKKVFKVHNLGIKELPEMLALIWINLRFAWYLWARKAEFEALYFRDESVSPSAWFAKTILRKGVFFEIHSVLESVFRQKLNLIGIRSASGVIAISSGLKKYYERFNKNILVSLCSAAEDDWFDYEKDKSVLRDELGLPFDAYIAGYTGVVGANPNNDYYEIDDVVRSLSSLPEKIILVVVGELYKNADWLREIARASSVENRLVIVPWQERSRIPKYLQAFDLNVIPRRKKDLIGDSPAKMFPALAAKRPIVAGRAESIEEVLTDQLDSLIVEENSPNGWTKAILKVYSDPELGERLTREASKTKDKYTWEKRGIAIGEFIKNLTN